MNKYHARKTTVCGEVFDSRIEAERYQQLLIMARAGLISDLRRQVKYELIPAQYRRVYNEKTGKWKDRCIERAVFYVADFVYTKDGLEIVEDTKGMRTKDYVIKRKLMLFVHNIMIQEV